MVRKFLLVLRNYNKKKINRSLLIKNLTNKGIEVRPTFFPLNLMKPFSKYSKGSYKHSLYLGLNGICLPHLV